MASNSWEEYKKRHGIKIEKDSEYQPSKRTNAYTWEQYKAKRAGQEIPKTMEQYLNPIKRGTYRSEVTAQYDPDDYKNERLAEEAYRIFAGEEAKTSSPGSVLRMGSGEYAAKPVDRGFVGPLETSEIWNPRSSINVGAGEYATKGRDWVSKDMGIPEDLLRGKTLKPPRIYDDEFIGPIGQYDEQEDLQERQRGLKMGNGEYATVTEGQGWKLNDMELFEDMLAGKTVTQPRTYDEAFIGPIGQYDTRDDIYARQRGLQMGNGEAAKPDPQMIGYDNLQNEPDFAEVLKGPQRVQMPDQVTASRTGLNPMEYNAALTRYMTGEEKNNYQYLLNKYGEAEADKYYATLEDALNQRQGLNSALKAMEWPGWAREMYELFTAGASGLQGALGGMRNAWNAITQNDQTAAIPAATYAKTVMAQNNGFWGNLAMDLAESFGQQIPQIMMNSATAGLAKPAAMITTLAPVGTSVLGNVYNQRLKEGYSPKDALKSALASAGLETGLEAIGGPAVLSAGALSEKAIDTIVDGIENGVKRFVARTGFDMLGEGAEEALSAALSPLLQNALLENNPEQFDWAELGYQTLVGALSGGVIGAPANVMTGYAEQKQKAVEAAAQGVKNPENTPEQKHNAAKTALEISGVENAENLADSVVKLANGEKLTPDEMLAIAQTDGALEVAQQIAGAVVENDATAEDDKVTEESNKVTTVTTVTGDEPEPQSEPVDAEVNRETAIEKAAKLGGERRIHEEIYDMGGGEQNAEAYSMEYERAYNRGRNSMPLTDQVAKTYKTLTQEQVQAAWNAGRAQQEGVDQKKMQRAKSVTGAQGIVDARELEGTKLNANQRAAMRSAGYVAQALGIKLVWHKSQVNAEGKRTLLNGWYVPKDRSVHLDIYAGSNSEARGEMYRYAAMRTFAHELTHMIEDTSPQQYGELRAMVFDHLEKKGYSVEAMISEKQRAGQSRYTATQELVADACEMMLQDTDALKTEMTKNPSLWEKVKEAFGKFVNDLRKALEGIRPTSKEALALMEEAEGVLRYAEELQKKWDEALLSTVQEAGKDTNVRTSEESAEQETEAAENTADIEQTEAEPEQDTQEPEQTAPEEEQREQLQRREGVTLMEERDWESIKNRSMPPFAIEAPEVREWFAMAAELLQEDLAASTPGQKHFIRDEAGNLQEVTGQKRKTVDEIAQLLDHGMTYRDIGNALDAYAQIDMDWIGKHPQTAKKAELMLDQMLMEGYTNIEGERISGVADYKALTDELAGRETKEPVEYDLGEDVRFSRREEGTEEIYDYGRSFADRVDDWKAGKVKPNESILMGETPELLRKIGLARLPMTINQTHVRYALNGGKDGDLDHVFYEEDFKNLPERINDPIAVISSETNAEGSIVIILKLRSANGKQAIAALNVSGYGEVNTAKIDSNAVVTVHGRKNTIEGLLQRAIERHKKGERAVFYLNKNEAISLWPNNQIHTSGIEGVEGGLIGTIRDNGSPVKPKFTSQTQTRQFREWFGKSVIVNEDGTAKKMYHGTPYGGFTVFRDWQYFTDNKEYADMYHSPSASSIRGRYDPATEPKTYEVYLRVEKPFDTRKPNIRKLWQREFFGKWGDGTPLSERGLPDWTEGIDLIEWIEENEYDFDAIILDEGGTGGYGEEVRDRGISVVVRSSYQVKSATDNIGTYGRESNDIRYQPREEDQISDRELLATALESVAQNAEERRILTEYKGKIAELDAKQRQADALRENMFRKGISREAMLENQKRYRQLMEEMTRADRKLLDLEAAAPMNTILKRERLNIHKRVQETRARSLQEYRERRNATEARAVMRRTIVTQTTRLRNRLESPKGGQYFIKDEMREYVSALVKAFTPGADDGLFPEIELAQVQAAYKDMFKDNPNLAENYDENVEENLGELARILPGKKMAQMTMEQLRMLRDCMDHTMNLVTDGERVFAEGRRQNVENWADPTIDKAGKDGKYLKQRWVEGVREFLNNGNATPIYFFKRIGGPLERLYKEFEKGEAVYAQDLWEARVVKQNLQKKYNYEKWADQRGDVLKFTTTNGKQLEIDRETAIALWATRERERRNPDDNVRHLEQGGFKLLRTDKWIKQGNKGWNFLNQKQEVGTELNRLSDIDNDKIANWLTAEQKGYATEMVRYLSTDVAEKGNAVSKILNGYSIFGEGFYFPYRTSADYRSKNLGAIENAMLKNMGFTKKVRKYAGNPIVIDSFTKVWEEHVNQMAMYHGMAIPQNTFWRVYNYVMPAGKDADGVDHEYESVRAAVKGAYGEGADKYIEQLMIDIYGGVKRTYGDSLGAKLASKFKRNAVTMSMSVVVQQYSSIARAWAVISPKYFASLQGDRFKAAKAEMLRYSATAKIKNMGRFDMNDGRSAIEWLEEKDYTGAGFLNRTKAFFTDAEMRERFYGYLPKLVDEKVWTQIWKAAKRETAERTGLTGDALCKATAERFDQIIRETQVYDSVLVRSQLMRDKGGWATMVTSFMGEPTLSYNMFMEAVRLAKNKEYKKAGAYLTAVEAAVVLNAVLKAIVSAYRDKDEDETYIEKCLAHLVGDLTGSVHNTKLGPVSVAIGGLTSPLLPFGNIPYVSDILEVFQGYDVTRNDMNVAADMYNAFTAAFSEEKSAGEKLRAWAIPFSALTAVPVSNVWRDAEGVLNQFINDKREWHDTTARGIKYAILAELGRKDTESAETERMLDAAIKGDTKTYESLRVHVSEDMGLTDKEITSAMKSRIRERYEEGDIDEKEAARLLEKYGGLADEKEDKLGAEREVRKWDVKAESGNNTLYGNIWNHIAQWDGPALKKEINELKKLGVEDSQIRSSVLGHFKEIYLNAGRTEKTDLKAHLITALTYMGDSTMKARERIKEWEEEE